MSTPVQPRASAKPPTTRQSVRWADNAKRHGKTAREHNTARTRLAPGFQPRRRAAKLGDEYYSPPVSVWQSLMTILRFRPPPPLPTAGYHRRIWPRRIPRRERAKCPVVLSRELLFSPRNTWWIVRAVVILVVLNHVTRNFTITVVQCAIQSLINTSLTFRPLRHTLQLLSSDMFVYI